VKTIAILRSRGWAAPAAAADPSSVVLESPLVVAGPASSSLLLVLLLLNERAGKRGRQRRVEGGVWSSIGSGSGDAPLLLVEEKAAPPLSATSCHELNTWFAAHFLPPAAAAERHRDALGTSFEAARRMVIWTAGFGVGRVSIQLQWN